MSDKSVMSARQSAELDHAFERNGYAASDVKWLSQGSILAEVKRVRDGYAEIKLIEHVVNGAADPFVPTGWSIELHTKSGLMKLERRGAHLYLNGKKIVLFVSEKQQGGKTIRGRELREELSGKKVFNANVLDYLLAHPELIPESWKEKTNGNTTFIFFWGTIYRLSDGYLFVRCLLWLDGAWHWRSRWLGNDFYGHDPAALRAS
ncbi:MAG: hypothetical protein A3D65_05515 [Candidatus Lloydbacteria bacterium RIFCSPHIGHO2_02_FULL_50_13]|uniref:Uncharacterized protein n=1 Tax=Candidatus Lloydbacteria bacterium RIFCSPHIGHO2_02_FULL_50_13 TaxID=1798661 RepID=A0A1G2D7Z0_9BACT|nr:MAG: hypothetical protein A3D65_05515 [Candidatus Lloydbacteria bacterium RIFCSPHIGHO2_02_FULL_50_13]